MYQRALAECAWIDIQLFFFNLYLYFQHPLSFFFVWIRTRRNDRTKRNGMEWNESIKHLHVTYTVENFCEGRFNKQT